MYSLQKDIRAYLHETLTIRIHLRKWDMARSLPFYLQDEFSYYTCDILNSKCLLTCSPDERKQTPAQIRKYFQTLQNTWPGKIIYVRHKITAFERKRLIEQKIPFIVPYNQMYLPIFGIELREYFRQIKSKRSKFRPSTQTIIINFLLSRNHFEYTLQEIVGEIGYSKMAISRAFDEIEESGLADITRKGRERVIRFGEDKRSIWEQSLNYMRNPVKKRVLTETYIDLSNTVVSGISALSHYSMIAPNRYETIAVSGKTWNAKKQDLHITIVPVTDAARYEIEVWHYDPVLFTSNAIADPFSLFLCLRNDEDERVQSSLNDMMRSIKW